MEYNNATVGGASCSYATLSNYNSGYTGMRPAVPPTNVVGKYIVPAYSAPGYGALTHDQQGSCGGYFNIGSAYGKDADTASTNYTYKLCN